MKKVISLVLALALCLSLCACGKSEAVKNVEAMIEALTEVTENMGEEIVVVRDAYDALSEEEQKKVKNYDDFNAVRDPYYEQMLVGQWYPLDLSLYEPEYIFAPRYHITLNADMSFTTYAYNGRNEGGQWEVHEGNLILHGIDALSSEGNVFGSPEGDFVAMNLKIDRTDAFEYLYSDYIGIRYYRETEYQEAITDVIMSVDCSQVDLNKYIGFTSKEVLEFDEWGTHTGTVYNRVVLQNLLYDDGWMYLGSSRDFLLEVMHPEFEEKYATTLDCLYSAGSRTVSDNPFTNDAMWINLDWSSPENAMESDLSLEELSFGRAKGMLYFINSKYVEDMCKDENNERILVLKTGTEFFLLPDVRIGPWQDGNLEY